MKTLDYIARKVAMNAAFGGSADNMLESFILNVQSIVFSCEQDLFRSKVLYHARDFMGGPDGLNTDDILLVDEHLDALWSGFVNNGLEVVDGSNPRKEFSELLSPEFCCRGAYYLLPDGKEVVRCAAAHPDFDGKLLDGFRERLMPCQAVEQTFRSALDDLERDCGYDKSFLPLENGGLNGLAFRHGDAYYVRGLPDGISIPLAHLPDKKLDELFDGIGVVKSRLMEKASGLTEIADNSADASLMDVIAGDEKAYFKFDEDSGPVVSFTDGSSARLSSLWLSMDSSEILMRTVDGKIFNEGALKDGSVESVKQAVTKELSRRQNLGENVSGKKIVKSGIKK